MPRVVVAEMKCVDSRETYKLKLTEVGCGLVRANKAEDRYRQWYG